MVVSRIVPALGFLRDLEVQPSITTNGIQVFALRRTQATRRLSYRTLDEALAAKLIAVSAAHEEGGKPTFRIMNQSRAQVFLMAGEHLVAAREDLVLDASLLVGPQETMKVPASRVHRDVDANPGGRLDGLLPPKDAAGVVFTVGDRIAAFELFDRKETLRKVWPKILRAHEQELGATPSGEAITHERVLAWLETAAASHCEHDPAPGMGQSLRFRGEGLAGRALLIEHELLHASIAASESAASQAATAPQSEPGSRLPQEEVGTQARVTIARG